MTTDYCNPFPKRTQKSKRHGMTRTKVYRAWINIKVRCLDSNCKFFEHYGGRGITIHPDWQDSFEEFYKEVGDPPGPKHSIDRIDNERGYEPGNCRWVTQKEQMENTRRNHPVTINGRTQNIMAWIQEIGIYRQTVFYRMRRGWDAERALTTPVKPRNFTHPKWKKD